jgi:uncharacterized protein (TIGR00375 family)
MKIIADLHIHSKYSRACSKELTLENIFRYSKMKGLNVMATGDFTHPLWFKEIKNKLIEKEKGLFGLKGGKENKNKLTRFILSTEISCIYTRGGKCRRLHVVVMMPSIETASKLIQELKKLNCNLKSDGRPIIGLDVRTLAEICFDISKDAFVIPAHIWTPWFAMFGSKSGFDSIEECWGDYSKQIFAVETGLSSDPQMNWRVKNLDKVSLVSSSDAHSLPNLGREANIFEIEKSELSYLKILEVIKNKDSKSFLETIEFYPEEGMYHIDGHRECSFSSEPGETKRLKEICPVCKRKLTVGVLSRVEELADPKRDENYIDKKRVPYRKLIELDKIIAESLGVKSRKAKKVQVEYMNLIQNLGTEFDILMNKKESEIAEHVSEIKIAEAVMRVRKGQVRLKFGFDGQYGEVRIF